jgi:hypothetical protein
LDGQPGRFPASLIPAGTPVFLANCYTQNRVIQRSFCAAAIQSLACLLRVKTSKVQNEQMFSALPPKADFRSARLCRRSSMAPCQSRPSSPRGAVSRSDEGDAARPTTASQPPGAHDRLASITGQGWRGRISLERVLVDRDGPAIVGSRKRMRIAPEADEAIE